MHGVGCRLIAIAWSGTVCNHCQHYVFIRSVFRLPPPTHRPVGPPWPGTPRARSSPFGTVPAAPPERLYPTWYGQARSDPVHQLSKKGMQGAGMRLYDCTVRAHRSAEVGTFEIMIWVSKHTSPRLHMTNFVSCAGALHTFEFIVLV